METILILIGLIAIFWFCSKAFNKLGNFFEACSKTLAHKNMSRQFIEHSQLEIEKINLKIDAMRDAQFYDKVRQEIDELTK
jgi:hypothetical protein